jgi:transcriptional regulator with XRE-family HTH domain
MLVEVYKKIEEVRKSRGVTKTYIAKKCNKTIQWYHGIAIGRRTPNVNTIQEIAAALHVKPGIFFED